VSYYKDKVESLRRIFGTNDLSLEGDALQVAGRLYPIVQDVIVLLPPERRPASVTGARPGGPSDAGFAPDVQDTFGREWTMYQEVLPEHEEEFRRYFDLVDLEGLRAARVCDLGCGIGRWSRFLADRCRELVLVDFSDAIFVARRNLASCPRALFFMGDIRALPFSEDFCDFLFCLGVLHHLPTPCLDEVRALRRWAPRVLVFLYYALDNQPAYFRWLLVPVSAARRVLSRVQSNRFRRAFSQAGALFVYKPLVLLGSLLASVGAGSRVPLYDFYRGKSLKRIEQDVYDRFFTRIEQRVSRRQIEELRGDFSEVTVSPRLPYWHFVARR
jgi:SAM-dependent methyltransferase